MNLEASGEEEESSMTPEHVKHVIDDCKKLLVPDAETILGAWGLIDADPSYVSHREHKHHLGSEWCFLFSHFTIIFCFLWLEIMYYIDIKQYMQSFLI